MTDACKNLEQLSLSGQWDNVFACLKIDVNATVELGRLKMSENRNDTWLDDHKATLNTLEVLLAIILVFDQIFYFALVWYLFLLALKFLRYNVLFIIVSGGNVCKEKIADCFKAIKKTTSSSSNAKIKQHVNS